jgi:hypothetical protein
MSEAPVLWACMMILFTKRTASCRLSWEMSSSSICETSKPLLRRFFKIGQGLGKILPGVVFVKFILVLASSASWKASAIPFCAPGALGQLAAVTEEGQDLLGSPTRNSYSLAFKIRLISSIFSESCGLWSRTTIFSPLAWMGTHRLVIRY